MLGELNLLCVALDEVRTSSSCPKMVATKDWEFLCAAHEKPKEVCIDVDTGPGQHIEVIPVDACFGQDV